LPYIKSLKNDVLLQGLAPMASLFGGIVAAVGEVGIMIEKRAKLQNKFLTDSALHSIGLLLLRQCRPEVFRQFLSDMVIRAGVMMASRCGRDGVSRRYSVQI
jgi:hypothetical protein